MRILASVVTGLLLASALSSASAAKLVPVHKFQGRDDGNNPTAGLVADGQGNFYGSTFSWEGAGKPGNNIYRLSPTGDGGYAYRVVHTSCQLPGCADGDIPTQSTLAHFNGRLYGTTYTGGVGNAGVIYEFTPPDQDGNGSSFAVIHDFEEDRGRFSVNSIGLVADATGNLYGVGDNGGPRLVYQLRAPATQGAPWSMQVIHEFAPGVFPVSLVPLQDGTLVGTTTTGGDKTVCAEGCGTVFQLAPAGDGSGDWTKRDLHVLQYDKDGRGPMALLPRRDGSMVGLIQESPPLGGILSGSMFLLQPPLPGHPNWSFHRVSDLGQRGVLVHQDGRPAELPDGAIAVLGYCWNDYWNACLFRVDPPAPGKQRWRSHLATFTTLGLSGSLAADATGSVLGPSATGGLARRSCAHNTDGTCGLVWRTKP